MVRTRFAPSPTGFLHVGHLRTALFSYALARKNKGEFVLRIEDTDKKREREGSIKNIIKTLKIFGINYDEGPDIGGPYAPYIQSQRLDIYKKKAEELVARGYAYYCFCSEERLTKLRETQLKQKEQPMYDGKCRELDEDEIKRKMAKGEKYVIRLKVPKDRKIKAKDEMLGEIEWDSNGVDDQVLLKSDGYPTYHLGVVLDDVLMKITHITRGFEWLASVPKHILLFEAFNYKVPVMAHMPLILDPAGGKLSKRKGSVSTEEFLKEGYLPEALLNFIMLLGWSPKDDRELFTLDEFVKEFSMDRLNKAQPVFDRQKLLWFNGEYIRKLSLDDLAKRFIEWTKQYSQDKQMIKFVVSDKDLKDKLDLIHVRVTTFSDAQEQLRFFYTRLPVPDISAVKGVKKYKKEDCIHAVKDYLKVVKRYASWKHEVWETDIRGIADKYKLKHGDMFMLVRLALCGSHISPPLFESMEILGKDEIVARLEAFN